MVSGLESVPGVLQAMEEVEAVLLWSEDEVEAVLSMLVWYRSTTLTDRGS